MKPISKDELLEKAKKPSSDALILHPFYKGKVEVIPKCCIRSFDDFAIWYTPGVAAPCKEIHKNPEKVYEHTNKWNYVAVASNGTRVLGLGDIGPLAGLPVMEGKALLFKYLGGVDAFPIMIDTKNPDIFIDTVKLISPTFGGINLEDISSPECFYILEKLRKELEIPVWHDDQQGTATVTLAGVINALKLVNKKLQEAVFAIIGAGAANICLIRVLEKVGVPGKHIIAVDTHGILHKTRKDMAQLKTKNIYKYKVAMETNYDDRSGGIEDALKGADVCISASTPGPDIIKKEWINGMANEPIVFTEANPVPEIWPWEAKEAGAKIVATGRSDFPNQVNNSLGFPGIFRGVLDVNAKTITDEMCITAAYELAKYAEEKGLSEDYITPTMEDWEVYPREATAVALKAIEQGVARIKLSKNEIYERAEEIIKRSRYIVAELTKTGIIKLP